MKKRKRKFLFVLLLIILGFGVWLAQGFKSGRIPRAMGEWLHVEDQLEKSDVIYVYGGGVAERPSYAAQLYNGHYARTVIVGGILMDANLMAIEHFFNDGSVNRAVLVKRGVPGKNIVQFWEGTSTYDETLALKRYMLEHKLRRAILVTSPFHTRRVGICARRVFSDTDIELIVSAPENSIVNLDHWWLDERDLVNIVVEYIKLGYYIVKYR